MKTRSSAVVLVAVLAAGCTPAPSPVVNLNDGYTHVSGGGTFDCNGRPTAIDGSHKDVILQNGCRQLRVTGSHDDIVAYVEPGAAIEVTGSNVDIVYRLMRRGAAPRWVNQGDKNNLIRNSRASWEQDHDWWQEQH